MDHSFTETFEVFICASSMFMLANVDYKQTNEVSLEKISEPRSASHLPKD